MITQISGIHLDIGDALRSHVEEKLKDSIKKYTVSERPIDAKVTFSKDAHEFLCEISVYLSTGLNAVAKARANDIYDAFEGAVNRLEKQLRRYKRRLKDHHKNRRKPIETIGAPSYVLEAPKNTGEDEPETLQPVIVAETETPVQTLSVGEAVMQMELGDVEMLVFRNVTHGGVNVVYIREDGNIGWIDPRNIK